MSERMPTPTPWMVAQFHMHILPENGSGAICKFESIHGMYANYEANAAFIVKCANSHDALVKKLEEIHDITQDTTLHVECWQKLQNIAATAASALASIKERS